MFCFRSAHSFSKYYSAVSDAGGGMKAADMKAAARRLGLHGAAVVA